MIRTIIVDDELLAGVGIQSLIDGKEDIQVSGVFNMPEDALVYLRKNIVDVVITDIEMAEMNGLEFIQIIREENLANGVIILSCHDDFAYAQEAISRGTDSYLLKHNISSKILVEEILKVYKKSVNSKVVLTDKAKEHYVKEKPPVTGKEVYCIGILKLSSYEHLTAEGKPLVDGTMLVHLLESIVSRYNMGMLFAPYNREIFIIFQFGQDMLQQDMDELLFSNISAISCNISQYISCNLVFGISTYFTDLKEVRKKYDEAAVAIGMAFYEPEKTIFIYYKPVKSFKASPFSTEQFLENDGLEIFEKELSDYLKRACESQIAVPNLAGGLIQEIGKLVYGILQEQQFSKALLDKWNSDAVLADAILQAQNAEVLKNKISEIIGTFRNECIDELEGDVFSKVLVYISQNLSDKLSLSELAEKSCMSIPTFSKKFKERTGMTLVQYLNEQRIERAKKLLKNYNYSLEQIAEKTGFSNTNYLIRVFKKVTGQTINEYRKV